jgi:hypothetical protein
MNEQGAPATRRQRVLAAIRALLAGRVTPVDVGKRNDGLTPMYGGRMDGGGYADKSGAERYQDLNDALEAWRQNPLARRIISLTTAYVVAGGIRIRSEYQPLDQFIREFWFHSRNNLLLRQAEWCDELARAGELFLVLFTNPADGVSHVRAVPAAQIDQVRWHDGDYETELAYHEKGAPDDLDGTWWISPDHPDAADLTRPVMCHYAVNRPVGAVRGEGDLAAVLPWIRRYSRWLEDRIRLNAGVRKFLWIVYAPKRLVDDLRARYSQVPDDGAVVIAEEGAERWEAVTPSLHASDASADGRAIRWMITAGGPGTGLVDFGEGEDANLATATAMHDLRYRFLSRRQAYMAWMLCDVTLQAYKRSRATSGSKRRSVTHLDFLVQAPDISPDDNQELAAAARDLAVALNTLMGIVGDSKELRRVSLRLFSKFAGETLTEREMVDIVETGVKIEQGAGGVSGQGPEQGRPVDQPSVRKPMDRPPPQTPKRPNPSRKQGRPAGSAGGSEWVPWHELHGQE